jgi:signal transduction histidine kinase
VRLSVAPGAALVEVEDRGRGIPADQLERVFEKFHRVEDPMRMTTGGTGLGLYIARELTRAMGGALSCRSVLGVGSTFVLRLDLAEPGVADPQEDGRPALLPRPRAQSPRAGAPLHEGLSGRRPPLRALN